MAAGEQRASAFLMLRSFERRRDTADFKLPIPLPTLQHPDMVLLRSFHCCECFAFKVLRRTQ